MDEQLLSKDECLDYLVASMSARPWRWSISNDASEIRHERQRVSVMFNEVLCVAVVYAGDGQLVFRRRDGLGRLMKAVSEVVEYYARKYITARVRGL